MSNVVVESFTTDINSVQLQLSNQKTLDADLLIAADGRLTNTRRQMGIPTEVKDFGKTCIVCKMKHNKPHNHLAYECFHYGRTLAVLPMAGNYSSIVITISSKKAESIMQMDDQDFNQDIASRFNHRFGEMQLEGERHAYPLIAVHANYFHSTRFALIGDASVGMHPVTAHGFNLGLKGAQILADLIKDALSRNLDIASENVLKQYNQKHQRNTRPLYHGTNLMVDLFNSEKISAKVLRRTALRFGNNFTPIKKIITNQLTETH
jgi:ubiquinone biosynthesis UbiH/UbiF/VisC/COQ6 family hydroxylase